MLLEAWQGKRQTVPQTKQRRAGTAGAAFTLVELIIVMALLMIVLGIAFPSLKGFFHSRKLASEARRFLALTHYGKSRAVSEGVPMMLWIDTQQGTYGLQAQPGYLDIDTNAIQFRVSDQIKIQVQSSPAVQAAVQLQQQQQPLEPPPGMAQRSLIRFSPDGFISADSPDQIVFRQGSDNELWIIEDTNHLSYEISDTNPVPSMR